MTSFPTRIVFLALILASLTIGCGSEPAGVRCDDADTDCFNGEICGPQNVCIPNPDWRKPTKCGVHSPCPDGAICMGDGICYKTECSTDDDCSQTTIICTVGTVGSPFAETIPTGRCEADGRCEMRTNNCVTTCEPGRGCLPNVPKLCSGPVLHVPSECLTIQAAVNAAPLAMNGGLFPAELTTVLIAPGTYHESVKVSGAVNVFITKDGDGEVVIDGGDKSAIATDSVGGTFLSISNITLQSTQTHINYTDATVFAEFLSYVELYGVTVRTSSIGLMVNYLATTQVIDSTFIGDGSKASTGIEWDHANTNDHVFYNKFENLAAGIYQCSGSKPLLSTLPGDDTNMYTNVLVPFYNDPDCH